MTEQTQIDEQVIAHAQELLAELEAGNKDKAVKALDELVRLRETSLFQELGKLTREFHEALNNFRLDARISSMAEEDIPDARQRLKHVIKMTNDAADRTLNAVEESIPLCEGLFNQSTELKQSWERFQRKEMQADEFRALSKQIAFYFDSTAEQAGRIKGNLNDVLMAQDFQDITGQIIQRVIKLVEEVENGLVNLIKLSSRKVSPEGEKQPDDKNKLEGPQVPGLESDNAVMGQDDVDDLLSSLGF
jgi:chemotaxis protein CheZ